ncbi:Panacea domain-containing protein [Leuconostoc mesenteroides]|uniref:Panacea domain-containing protein n=1 Tax=Leuconostoc mesenteroides TaxID=1245 RepID=UPI002360D888|nr:type II toxin-antitoxin system antitoxin SocA domain-containing protein [Leuconostoc mesenteroides]
MTMLNFAMHVIDVAQKNHLPITNLQLQKVMYFSFKEALSKGLIERSVLEQMYDEPFQVWRYGPVVRTVYEKYNIYSGSPIIEPGETQKSIEPLNSVIEIFLRKNPFELVNASHNELYWKQNKEKIIGWRSDVNYSISDIA